MRGVTFGTKHSFNDYGLYLLKKPVISPPKAKTHLISIPAADGSIDLSCALTGHMMFEMRSIEMKFIVVNGRNRWDTVFSVIMNDLHGKTMKIQFDDDAGYYYYGLIQVQSMACSKKTSTITINASVEPYKLKNETTEAEWKWDGFNFELDAINEVRDLVVDGTLTVNVYNCGDRWSVPVFDVQDSSNLTITYNGETYDLEDGENTIHDIQLHGNECTIVFKGSGTVTIIHRGGSL